MSGIIGHKKGVLGDRVRVRGECVRVRVRIRVRVRERVRVGMRVEVVPVNFSAALGVVREEGGCVGTEVRVLPLHACSLALAYEDVQLGLKTRS